METKPGEYCSGHGKPYKATDGDPYQCWCEDGYTGGKCEKKVQLINFMQCPNSCSGNGLCMNGRCVCSPGMRGVDCSLKICAKGWSGPECKTRTCPNDCSAAGICMDGKCTCSVGMVGEDCSVPEACWPACQQRCEPRAGDSHCVACVGQCRSLMNHPTIGKHNPMYDLATTFLDVSSGFQNNVTDATNGYRGGNNLRHKEVYVQNLFG